MKLTLIALALAAAAWGTPIGVSGTATMFIDLSDAVLQSSLSISGSDGVRSISADCQQNGGISCGLFSDSQLGANIDGQHFSRGFFTVILGDHGNITGYDSQHNPVITEEITGYLEFVSQTCIGKACQTSYRIAAAPEPSAWLLTAGGLALFWRRRA